MIIENNHNQGLFFPRVQSAVSIMRPGGRREHKELFRNKEKEQECMPTLIHHRHIINLHTARCSERERAFPAGCVIHSSCIGEECSCDGRSISSAGVA